MLKDVMERLNLQSQERYFKSQIQFLEVRNKMSKLKKKTTTTTWMGLAADLDNAKDKISFGNIAVETI